MKLKIILLAISVLMIPIGYLLLRSYNLFGVCIGQAILQPGGEIECYPAFVELGWMLQNIGLYLLPVTFLLLFATKRVFSNWLKYARWFVPFSLLIIFVYNENRGEWIYIGKSTVAEWLSHIFFIWSASIIFFSNLQKFRKK